MEKRLLIVSVPTEAVAKVKGQSKNAWIIEAFIGLNLNIKDQTGKN